MSGWTKVASEACWTADDLPGRIVEVHARFALTDDLTLCERADPSRVIEPTSSMGVLNLDVPGSRESEHAVTCSECIEWMHA